MVTANDDGRLDRSGADQLVEAVAEAGRQMADPDSRGRLEELGDVLTASDSLAAIGEMIREGELERAADRLGALAARGALLRLLVEEERLLAHFPAPGNDRVVVDGVAYAPHRPLAVKAWGVDYYAFSLYKVYGPHMAVMYGKADALAELTGPNHFFIREVPYQFELGGPSHEGCAGLLGLRDYLKIVAGVDASTTLSRSAVERAFDVMTACERPLQARLLEYLRARQDVRVVGPAEESPSRVGTISFVHSKKSSRAITRVVDRSRVAIRHGHMYAYRLCEALELDPDDGVVRVSLVHYNTPAEIDSLIEVLDRALD